MKVNVKYNKRQVIGKPYPFGTCCGSSELLDLYRPGTKHVQSNLGKGWMSFQTIDR